MQVWYENNYDTRLLHSNFSFPLLKKLSEVGDLLAKKVFKYEIAQRFMNGSFTTRFYLYFQGYLECCCEFEYKYLLEEYCDKLEFNNLQYSKNKDTFLFLTILLDRKSKCKIIKKFI